jgi:hypothetical protein
LPTFQRPPPYQHDGLFCGACVSFTKNTVLISL